MLKIRRCGGSFACCDGNCESCPAANTSTSNRTDPPHPMYSNRTCDADCDDDSDYDMYDDDDADCTCFD